MKHLIPILALALCAGCATRKPIKTESASIVPGTTIPSKTMRTLRTPETVKAYSVGRYTDPNFPEEMHERHTVYRREQSPDWNYLPDPPVAPTSNPSPSYHAKTEGGGSARQQAYAEALQEQNRAMKSRIEALQRDANKVPNLEQEIDRLKKQLDEIPAPRPSLTPEAPEPEKREEDVFSSVEPELPAWEEGVSESGDIPLSADSDDQSQALLISRMRFNDEFAAAMAKAEQHNLASALNAPFLRRREIAFLNKHTP